MTNPSANSRGIAALVTALVLAGGQAFAQPRGFADTTVILNGLRLHYLEWGATNKPAMLLISALGGGGGSAWTWVPFAGSMRADYHVLAFEPRGCGESQWGKAYTLDSVMADIDAFVDRFHLAPVVLVGHSSGATWTLTYASEHPNKVASVVAIEPGARPPGTLPPARAFGSVDEAIAFAKRQWQPDSLVVGALEDWIRHGVIQDAPGRWDWRNDPKVREAGVPTPDEYTAHLRNVSSRVLLVRGANSQLVRKETAERDSSLMKDVRIVVLPHAGHVAHFANPDSLVSAVRVFLRTQR